MAQELGEVGCIGSKQITSEEPRVLDQLECAFGQIDSDVSSRQSNPPHSFTSIFPPELLCHIFALIASDAPIRQKPSSPGLFRPRRTLGWFVVAHFCHQWREIAIGSPTLWQHVDFATGLAWATDMLARAKAMPVTIEKFFYIPFVASSEDQVLSPDPELELMQAHLFHTARLYLTGNPAQLTRAMQAPIYLPQR
ncbi:hypothetical protein BV25DRAFT_168597 [Artomyces pyxidatus]|uniref:Uncharacterized protein n=1 Tax=Artomyces pyxidatus TaxID=48021 RepID=A0ACB8SGH7_9AGAM|nr:hypothetical protein BV25DRAFT_168597 [Artomyces pyxidatus]